jgi:hypothetical protein
MIKAHYTVDSDLSETPRWDGTIFLAGPIERVTEGQPSRMPRWREAAITYMHELPAKLVIYNPQWVVKPKSWTYEAQVEWELGAMSRAMVRLFWVERDFPYLPGFTTNIEWGKWWDDTDTVSGAPPDALHVRYMQTLHRFAGKPWYTSLKQCCDVAVGLLPNSGPKPLVAHCDANGPIPTYCPATGWPDPITE